MNTTSPGRVVVGVPDDDDPGRLDVVLDTASAFNRQRRGTIMLLRALRPQHIRNQPGAVENVKAVIRARELLTDATLRLTSRFGDRVRVQTAISPLPPVTALIDASRHADLVVLLRRRLSTAHRLLHGFITSSVALNAYSPVMVIPERDRGGLGYVLVGVACALWSREALGFAFEEASSRRVPLVAMHAWQHRPDCEGRFVAHDKSRQCAYERVDRRLSEALADFARRYPDVVVRRHLVSGTLLDNLLPATGQAQLTVIGRHPRDGESTRSDDTALGHLLSRSLCPIVVAPAHPSVRLDKTLVGSSTR